MFQLNTADFAVYQHMKENPELYSEEAINDVRELLLNDPRLDSKIRDTIGTETQEYREKQPKLDAKIADGMSNVNHCLENVHLYADNHDTTTDRLEVEHRDAMAHHSKTILPYHERQLDDGGHDQPEHVRKTVSFDDGLL